MGASHSLRADPPGCGDKTVPKVDCTLSAWQEWTTCPVSCGPGQSERFREVAYPASGGGAPCEGSLKQIGQCDGPPCAGGDPPVDCQWGQWSDWGACTKCSGQRARSRHIVVENKNGGQVCDM